MLFIFIGEDYDGPMIISKAQEDMEEWNRRVILEEEPRTTTPVMRTVKKWQPPMQPWLKCNTDRAWDQNKEYCIVGWVLRDHQGNVKWMGARRLLKLKLKQKL